MTGKNKSKKTVLNLRRDGAVCLFLIIATFAVYWQVTNHEFINFDDNVYIYNNRHVLKGPTLDGVKWAFSFNETSYWHPVTWLSLMLDARFFGKNPSGYHLENVVLHLLSSLLLFYILRRMTHAFWSSVLVAALFALHPMNVESVAWATERKNVLSTLFWMLTALAYIRYAAHPNIKRYLPVFMLFALGLMAKPFLATLPMVFLLLDFWPLGRINFSQPGISFTQKDKSKLPENNRRVALRLILEKIPLMLLSIAAVMLSSLSVSQYSIPTESITLPHRIATSLISYVLYMVKMIWPAGLAVYYPYPLSVPVWQALGAGVLLAMVTVIAIGLARKAPYVTMGWLWFLGTFFPVIGLVQAGMWPFIADRFGYVPLIGLYILAAWGVPDVMKKWRYSSKALPVMAVIVLLAYALAAWYQAGYWQNSGTLFEHTLAVTSNNNEAHLSFGAYLVSLNKIDEALSHFYEAVRLKPSDAEAHANLANLLIRSGKLEEALAHLHEALRLKPDYAGAHNNMVDVLVRQGKLEEALAHAREALRLKPDESDSHSNMGVVLESQGKHDEAIEQFSEALRLDPENVKAHYNLGVVLDGMGKLNEARMHYYAALSLDPGYANTHYSIGSLFFREGMLDSAYVRYNEALRLNPEYAGAHFDLGSVLIRMGKPDEALSHFKEALRLRPDYPEALYNLGNILARQGKLDSALVQYNDALRLKPDYAEVHTNIGNVFFSRGKLDSALVHYNNALHLKPGYAEVHNNMGSVYFRLGRLNDAILHYKEALRLKPDYTDARNNLANVLTRKKK